MNGIAAAGRRVTVSGASSDAHPWNLVSLQPLLEGPGHRVRNPGGPAPDTVIIDSCRAERPFDRDERTGSLPAGVS